MREVVAALLGRDEPQADAAPGVLGVLRTLASRGALAVQKNEVPLA